MKDLDIKDLLTAVKEGSKTIEDAMLELKRSPFDSLGFRDLGYAKVDTHRKIRQGVTEVIYGAGKTPEQIAGIAKSLRDAGNSCILVTRLDAEKHDALAVLLPEIKYYPSAKIGILGEMPVPESDHVIAVVTAGTSDMPVAEEAAITAEALGNKVIRIYDAGVAGIHRLLSHTDELMSARVVIAIAGMEGALASVVGGLVDCPVIAVPTSVGYGAAFEGMAALLAMLNSCASGVSVVNIDNGFGAGYIASMINKI